MYLSSRLTTKINIRYFDSSKKFLNLQGVISSNNNESKCNLFIGNLPFSFTSHDLLQLSIDNNLEGCIETRIVTTRKEKKSRGFGYLDFSNKELATNAFNTLTKTPLIINDREIKIDLSETVNELNNNGRRKPLSSSVYQLYLKDLSFNLNEYSVYKAFDNILFNNNNNNNTVINNLSKEDKEFMIKIPITKEKQSRGFGYAIFRSKILMDYALSTLNGLKLMDREIQIEVSIGKKTEEDDILLNNNKKSSNIISNTVFLGNLGRSISSDLIYKLINEHVGKNVTIKRLYMASDQKGGYKDYAYIDFDSYEISSDVVFKLNSLKLQNGNIIKADLAINKYENIKPLENNNSNYNRRRDNFYN